MEQIIEKMMEYICDNICAYPDDAKDQESLEKICSECKMEDFINQIKNAKEPGKEQKDEITPEEVVKAYNTIRNYCNQEATCRRCVLADTPCGNNFWISPDTWPEPESVDKI